MKQSYVNRFALLFVFLFTISIQSQSLTLSDTAEISLITCGPGNELYSTFGHSAYRVRDPKLGLDKVYNYGTFDFDNPNFYTDFAKGNLNYFLSSFDFSKFLRSYHREKRWVKAQILDLSHTDIQKMYDFLENNALPENREYLYDYFFDNCSTKPFDVIEETIGLKLVSPSVFENENNSHRQLIQPYLKNLPWGDFGIDICLGSIIDRKATQKEYLFLPENVFTYFETLQLKENDTIKPIVKRTEVILLEQEALSKKPILTPFLLFSLIGLLVLLITLKNIKSNSRSRWLDFGMFFFTGFAGVVLLSIWFATNHISARNNYNTLWAFAPNIIVSFVMLKKQLPKWVKTYCLITLGVLVISLLFWVFKVQVFSIAVLPILILLAIRYIYLWKYSK